MQRPRLISLFSGAGGLDYGFEAAGYDTRLAVDLDPDCTASLRASRPWRVLEGDLSDISSEQLLAHARLRPGTLDVLIGGPPCQPFSKSGFWSNYGNRRLADPRTKTLSAYMRVVEETLPKVFVLENVQGLQFTDLDDGFRLLLRRIEQINKRTGSKYEPVHAVLNAASFGVPQIRHRLFLVAVLDGTSFAFPKPTHGEECAQPYRSAWDAIGDIIPDATEEELDVTGKWARLLPSVPEGENYQFHTSRGGGEPLFGYRCRYWTFLLKLAKCRPAWTIQANPGPSCGPFHWSNRKLSIRELARLQTFPDSARFTGTVRSQRRQIGNAVPSLMAEVIAREIAVQVFGARRPRSEPKLRTKDAGSPPPPCPASPVPPEYRSLVGHHADHPGVGRGRGALRRAAE